MLTPTRASASGNDVAKILQHKTYRTQRNTRFTVSALFPFCRDTSDKPGERSRADGVDMSRFLCHGDESKAQN